MTEKEIINEILNSDLFQGTYTSTLSISIRGARDLSNRDLITGKEKNANYTADVTRSEKGTFEHNKFLALANYLIIVDLIGNVFRRKEFSEIKNDRFNQALEHFTDLSKAEISSMKNLRNSLAHTFSLGNNSEIFSISYSFEPPRIVTPPIERYNKEKRTKGKEDKNYTIINYTLLCDQIESIYSNLFDYSDKDEIELVSEYKMNGEIRIHDIRSRFFLK